MKGNGLERDTLDGVIKDLERLNKKWQSSKNQMNYCTLRDALWYLKELKFIQERPLEKRLIDILREVRDERDDRTD